MIRRNGGILAQKARIQRDSPQSGGHAIDNATLVLTSPTTIADLQDVNGVTVLIIPEEPWVVGQVQVAAQLRLELGLKSNLHAMLPAEVRIFRVELKGSIIEIDSGRVNYLRVEISD